MRSLRTRLNAYLALALTVVFALQWLIVNFAIRRISDNYVYSRLEHDADSIAASLRISSQGDILYSPRRTGLVFEQPFSGHYFEVNSGGAALRSRSLWDEQLPGSAVAPGETRRLRHDGPNAQPLLVLVRGFQLQGHAVTITVAEDMTEINADIRQFQFNYLVLSGIALCIAPNSLDTR